MAWLKQSKPRPSGRGAVTVPVVIAINREATAAYLADASVVPIADWLDAACEPCEPDDAVWCLVGPIPAARHPWQAVPVESLDTVRH